MARNRPVVATITLPGELRSTQHIYRPNGRGGSFMSAAAKAAKTGYQWEAREQWKGEPINYPIIIHTRFFFGSHRKRDLDNHNKLVLDGLARIVYEDDSQIDELHLYRDYDKANPRVEITIMRL